MKLTCRMLADHLPAGMLSRESYIRSNQTELSRPVFYEKGRLGKGCLYIFTQKDTEKLPAPNPECGVISLYPLPEEFSHRCAFYLPVPAGFSPAKAFNLISDVFNRFDQWENLLHTALISDSGIQELLNAGSDLFGNPLLCFNSDFMYLAYSREIDMLDSLSFLRPDENMNIQTRYISDYRIDPESLLSLEPDRSMTLTNEKGNVFQTIAQNIRVNDQYVCRLVLCNTSRPFYDSDTDLLSLLSKAVMSMLERNASFSYQESRKSAQLICGYMAGLEAPFQEVRSHLQSRGWKVEDPYVTLQIGLDLSNVRNMTVASICRQLDLLIPGSINFALEASIAVAVNLRLSGLDANSLSQKITPFLKTNGLTAGISNPFIGFSMSRYYYPQTTIALEKGAQLASAYPCSIFEEYALDYMIEQSRGQFLPEQIAHPALIRLKEYDEKNQTGYYETLETYFLNRFNAVHAAADLGIHRTTFAARMDKIMELTGLDLEDPDEILLLQLSFRLMEG